MNYRPNLRVLIERLLKIERRVRDVYLTLSERPEFFAELRDVWSNLATTQEHHRRFLAHSAGLLNFIEVPPAMPESMFADVEAQINWAEAATSRSDLSIDEAFRQAFILEDSALKDLVDAWVQGFSPPLESLLHTTLPEKEACLRRLIEAVQTFSTNPALHGQAAAIWTTHQRRKRSEAREGATSGR